MKCRIIIDYDIPEGTENKMRFCLKYHTTITTLFNWRLFFLSKGEKGYQPTVSMVKKLGGKVTFEERK